MSATITPLQRLITRRSWLDANGIRLMGWTVLAAGAVVLLLVVLTLLVDVLVIDGSIEQTYIEQGRSLGIVPAGVDDDAGLLVEVVRFRNVLLWGWLPVVVENLPLLQTKAGALSVLVILTLLLVVAYSYARTRGRVAAARSSRELATWLRSAIHRQTLRLGPSDLTGQRHQAAMNFFIHDTEHVREAAGEWRWRLVRSRVLLPVLLLCILAIDPRLGLECLIPAIACWFVYRYERQQGAAKRQVSEAHAETEVRFLSEALKQTRLVRGYNMEEFEQTLFSRHMERMVDESRAGRRLERAALSTARFVTFAGLTLVLLLISLRVISATQPLPLCSAIAMVVALVAFAIEMNSWDRLSHFRTELEVSGDRIYRYLDEIPEVGQAVGARFIEPVSKSIVLEAVHYQQQGHQILRGVDLRIEARTEVALVSLDPLLPKAVAYLLPRFIEPSKGRVLFDGEDIAWGTLESIRTETLYVGGDDPILSGTVLDNILCGDSRYSLQDAIEAAKLVHAHKFISHLSQGYETILGEHGEQLDVGAAFRLGLARAALRDPAVLVIEEPRVLLDDDAKNLIDDAYQRLAQGRTIIYLPGRLTTNRRCSQVVLLHEGTVQGVGPHSELTKASELYRHWDYVTFNTYSRRSRRMQQA